MKLQGKCAVITGGAGGIGREIAMEFARAGAATAIYDIDCKRASDASSQAEKEFGVRAGAYEVDVTDSESVAKATADVVARYGSIDIWVNSAAISRIVPFLDCSEEIWRQTIEVNLTGTFLCCKEAVKHMLGKKKGSIINMSSQSGKQGNSCYQAYCASKFGIIGLTQSIAVEFAKEGIRANAICPGVVETEMWEKQIEDYANKRGISPEEVMPYFREKIPMGRIGTTQDISKLALFLASDDSSYITGQAINVSGGALME